MATARKSPSRATKTPEPCWACSGTGQVAVTVRVGRKHRAAGQQEGICLACYGTGLATDPE